MMYNELNLDFRLVSYEDEMMEVWGYLSSSGFMSGIKMDSGFDIVCFERYLTQNNIYFHNVYYENKLIGYIILDVRSHNTVEYHWGVCNYSRYLVKIMPSCFDLILKMGFNCITGWVSTRNALSLKVAKRFGFKLSYKYTDYYEVGHDAYLMVYNKGGKDGTICKSY